MKQPLVSVIISTKNNIRTIQRCLLSIKEQTYPNIELIVVDNHSTDGTLEIAKKLANHTLTAGPERSAQRNFGAKKALGTYVLIHDSDVYFPPTAVADCINAVFEGRDIIAVILPEKSVGIGYWAKVKAFEREFYIENDLIEAARFFNKKVFTSIGGYDQELNACEDWDLQNRLNKHGKTARTTSFLLHDEGRVKIYGSSIKKSYYAKWIRLYKQKYPQRSSEQFSALKRFRTSQLIRKGIRHPLLLSSMILMKTLELFYTRTR
jgi:glycosyltransferase involved in cell wall biosynthesis